MAERRDRTGFGDITIIQDNDCFCYGIDAVLLAHIASEGIKEKHLVNPSVMDLGTGNGIVPLILSYKTDSDRIYGLEFQEKMAELAKRSVILNGLDDRIKIEKGDVRQIVESEDKRGTFDIITSNPPYTEGNRGVMGKNHAVNIARHELEGSLDDFIKAAAFLLRDRGDFYMVHRPSRLVDICVSMRMNRIEPKEIRFITGRYGGKPNILLVHAVKNGNRELKVLPSIAARNDKGDYTEEILRAYR